MRVAGIGCRATAPGATLRDLLAAAGPIDLVAGLAGRADLLRPVAAGMGLAFVGIAEADLAAAVTPTQSARVASRFGTGSVAEAAALVAAGRNARVVVQRKVSPDATATLAIAEGDGP